MDSDATNEHTPGDQGRRARRLGVILFLVVLALYALPVAYRTLSPSFQ